MSRKPKSPPRDTTSLHRQADLAANQWIGKFRWTQQAGLPGDLDSILRAMWIHGYIAGYEAQARHWLEGGT